MKWIKPKIEKSPPKKLQNSPKTQLNGNFHEILYTKPNRPLDFSFKDLTKMDDLITAQPRNGIRKQLNTTIEGNVVNNSNNNKVEEDTKDVNYSQTKKKVKEVKDEIIEQKIFFDRSTDNNKAKKRQESKNVGNMNSEKVHIQKIIKYLPYTNAIILHSNNITSLDNIHNALNEILPEVEFLKEKEKSKSLISRQLNYSKIDLLQWIDLSHNKLETISQDILKLPFLKILYMHANLIKNLEEITVLSGCKALINLTLHGNPIEHIKGYRLLVIEMMGCLEKLDFTLVSEKELDIIHFRGARFGEVRNKFGSVVKFPQLDKEILKRMNMGNEEAQKDM